MKRFGAVPEVGGVRFRVHAPEVRELQLVLESGGAAGCYRPGRDADGIFDLVVDGAAAGDRYTYRLDGGGARPDPASRFQPEGVHGPSEIVDPGAFAWTDEAWRGRAANVVVYELHVGTFTPAGTFRAAAARLPELADLGVTAVELMPIADFPGARNWGYDGVCLFAPARAYGRPDAFRSLVDTAHRLGLAVILDVVYNHLGPDGAYLPEFNPRYLTDRHSTPWGRAINLDGEGSAPVRRFIIDNALHWVREYHVDGLRLDATHALVDDSPVTLVAELAATLRASSGRPVLLHAEDCRNLAAMIADPAAGGWGLDAVWADDFHHAMRRHVAGDSHSYYADYDGTSEEITRIVEQGWLFTGQPAPSTGTPRGTDPAAVPMDRFVVCLQNHDQIGNRAFGDRLNTALAAESWRAASVALLTSPMTPLIFMGQEWAATTPFQFFTDMPADVGALVSEGRRHEFAAFPDFADAEVRRRIPDPQSESTFAASRLVWEERGQPAHAAALALYRALLTLRQTTPALAASRACRGEAFAPDHDSLVMRRGGNGATYWIAARLRTAGEVDLTPFAANAAASHWEPVLTTEDQPYSLDPHPVRIEPGPRLRFARAGAVILSQTDAGRR